MNPGYEMWTLEELEAENQRLLAAIQEIKTEQDELLPYLDAAWVTRNAEEAAKADPRLTQSIGRDVTAYFDDEEGGQENG